MGFFSAINNYNNTKTTTTKLQHPRKKGGLLYSWRYLKEDQLYVAYHVLYKLKEWTELLQLLTEKEQQ